MSYKIYHLSHTDLDGYGCQMITNHFFKNVEFLNSNYGKEIHERVNQIMQDIANSNIQNNLILITDLNLTLEDAKNLEAKVKTNQKDIELILLDHHKSGQDCANEFEWYFLDHTRSATKITYDFFSSIMNKDKNLSKLVDVINAVDIWLDDSSEFELGKVCLGLISGAKEINRIMFNKENTNYMFSILQNIQPYFSKQNPHIALDEATHNIKKVFFKKDKDDTLSNLVSACNVSMLTTNRDKMKINYGEFKGILTYNIGNVSIIGNDFLKANPNFDFFMDITSRKTISLRANGKIDVSKMAAKIGNGGGHPNASGGLLNSFKGSFMYDDIRKQVTKILQNKGVHNHS
ncbi:MAG: 3'-to-5' oligoribonuclease B [Sulfurospirillum sp.]|nr:3'-to-5' oligoribonuclease B [Sulfurospirillum sp.]